jgi:hypothetical protein
MPPQGLIVSQARRWRAFCLLYSSTMKMGAIYFSETSAGFQLSSLHYISEDPSVALYQSRVNQELTVKGKGKVIPVWSSSLPGLFTPAEVALLYPLDRRLGGDPEPVWTLWRKEKSCPSRLSNIGRPTCSPSRSS